MKASRTNVIAWFSMRVIAVLGVLAACHAQPKSAPIALREACAPSDFWDGVACKPRGDGAAKIAAGKKALADQDVDAAKLALDAAAGPLDHAANVLLWEQRAIAAAYVDDEPSASAAFDMLLALDPAHVLSY